MKSIILPLILLLVIQDFALSAGMHTATTTSEDIQITATAIVEDDQRTLVTCVLTNHSKHILASTSTRSPARCFRFVLRDKNGEVVPMDEIWALRQAQPNHGTETGARGGEPLSGSSFLRGQVAAHR